MNAVITFALKQRVFLAVLLPLVLIGGLALFNQLNIEAYPDPVPPLVDIVTQSTGQSAEEIERYITIPIEIQMAGLPHVSAVRTISLFGLSDVKVQFNELLASSNTFWSVGGRKPASDPPQCRAGPGKLPRPVDGPAGLQSSSAKSRAGAREPVFRHRRTSAGSRGWLVEYG